MGEYSINIVKKNVDKELFLRLPSKIYDEKHIVQNKTFEKEVLENTSVLCKGVKNFALIVKNKNDEPVGRSVVSLYEDDTVYIGFFECIKDIEVSKLLLAECERIAKEAGKKRLLGPIYLFGSGTDLRLQMNYHIQENLQTKLITASFGKRAALRYQKNTIHIFLTLRMTVSTVKRRKTDLNNLKIKVMYSFTLIFRTWRNI